MTTSTPLDHLHAAVSGIVTTPADAGYDAARAAWNLAADQRPAAVVHAAGTADLVATVRAAAALGLRVAPQATGHGAACLGPLDDAILLRTDDLRGVAVDLDAQTVRVQAGAQWADVVAASAPHGLAPLAGSAGDVGVVGFHLGGGLSFLSRLHGVAARHLVGGTVVLADGTLHTVDADSPELLWALRGGGGTAVVAELEFALHRVPELSTGQLFWPIERAGEVLRAWRDWAEKAPREITTSARFLRFPADPAVPEPLRGGAFFVVDGAFAGEAAEAEAALAPLRALTPAIDLFGPAEITSLVELHMDPPAPVPAASAHTLLRELPDDLIERLDALAGVESGSALVAVELRQLGGALATGDPEHGAIDGIDAPFLLFAVGLAGGPVPLEVTEPQLRAVLGAAAPYGAGTFPNFAEGPGADAPRPAAVAGRLARLRGEHDPDGLLIAAHA
ncbi:MAG: FAD-dependent oxidoreductase [Patulibacter minatonensis]